MFDTFIGRNWAMPATSTPWAIAASITEWIKRATHYHCGVHLHHWCWERSHGDRSRKHPWQSLRASA